MVGPGGRADLHCHTVASDGALEPAAVVRLAAEHGVQTLAITDHDTLAGVAAAQAEGRALGVRVVVGVELSARTTHGSMHILGYFAEAAPPLLLARLAELRAGRVERAAKIVAKLAALGAPLDLEAVLARADGPVGRPHIADALIAAGHAHSRQQAFDRYLADGGPAWVASEGLAPIETLALIRESGGVSALAHPATLRLPDRQLAAIVQRLSHHGLDAIEVHRPEHVPEQRHRYGRLAERFSLVASGGSDFHRLEGRVRPGDTGEPSLPGDTIDRLWQRLPSAGPGGHPLPSPP